MEKKVVIMYRYDVTVINKMLSEGWEVKQMSACAYELYNEPVSECYVYLTRNKK